MANGRNNDQKVGAAHHVKNVAKKKVKKKAGKAIAKALVKAMAKAIALIVKLVMFIVSSVGLPTIFTVIGVILLIILVNVLITSVFGGLGSEDTELSGKAEEIRTHIVEQVNGTIDPDKPEQEPYKLPQPLVATVMQLDVMQGNETEMDIIDQMANKLAPDFTYKDFDIKTETYTRTCENGNCTKSSTSSSSKTVSKLTHVDSWDGDVDISYDKEWSEWEVVDTEEEEKEVEKEEEENNDNAGNEDNDYDIGPGGPVRIESYNPFNRVILDLPEETNTDDTNGGNEETEIIKKTTYTYERKQSLTKNKTNEYDYSKFEEVLFEYDYTTEDIQWMEGVYAETGGEIYYTDWLDGEVDGSYNGKPTGNGSNNPNPNGVPNLPPVDDGLYTAPTTGYITSGYGYRSGGMHEGIDIGRGNRTNVGIVAIADGTVTRSYLSESYGNVVYISHNLNGVQYETVSAHMVYRAVQQGEKVKKGQLIGEMGSTGHSTGPHLHFEIHSPSWNFGKTNSFNPLANNQGVIISIPGN